MKIVYSWLKDFIDIELAPEEVATTLTSIGIEVASIKKRSIPQGVIVAKVIEVEKHPNADKLTLCKVDIGEGKILSVVCGAPNVRKGMLSALATIGTKINEEFTIKKAKIRGVESEGMLCSAKELNISEDHSGIIELSAEMEIGKSLSHYYPDDAIIEIELTPNRGDCLSVLGVARELAAKLGLKLKDTVKKPLEEENQIDNFISVVVEAKNECPRYTGRLIRGVKIKPSPNWLAQRLIMAGLRPINNVVDVTNYILLQFGQPMHAFDYSKIEGKKIVVKLSERSQKFNTLDGIEREVLPEDLLITDAHRPIALAGIMGGEGSEITDETTDVFLECAYFDPLRIRKTSRRLGLITDSSYRFERGVDPEKGLKDALDTAAAMIAELGEGKICKGMIDIYPTKLTPKKIIFSPEKCSKLLGVNIPPETMISTLESLQIKCNKINDEKFECIAPLFRHDLSIEEDLIEEVGRFYGYDNIPHAETAVISLTNDNNETEKIIDTIRYSLAFAGFNEAVTNSMTSEKKVALLTPNIKPVKLLNPLNPEMAVMRTTLLGSLLEITAYNCNRKNFNNRFFEVGKIFELLPSGEYSEKTVVGVIIENKLWDSTWKYSAQEVSYYIIKGIIEAFSFHLGYNECTFVKSSSLPTFFSNEAAEVVIDNSIKGYAGVVKKEILDKFDIKTNVCYAEIDISNILECGLPQHYYKPIPKYPALERDFSFVMDENREVKDVIEEIKGISPLIESIYPFDLYRGEKIGVGKKSITFNVKFRAPDRTLTDEDVDGICKEIISIMEKKHNITLRT